MQTLMLLKLA